MTPFRLIGLLVGALFLGALAWGLNLIGPGRAKPTATASASAAPDEGVASLPARSGEARMPPRPEQIEAVRTANDASLPWTLQELMAYATNEPLLEALDGVESRSSDAEVLGLVACLRGRVAGSDLDRVFLALPDLKSPRGSGSAARCLVDVIAARADEDPARAAHVLAERAIATGNYDYAAALARLDLDEAPAVVEAALAASDAPPDTGEERVPFGKRVRKDGLIRTVIALRGAERWPDRVAGWIASTRGSERRAALEALLKQPDAVSLRLVAGEAAAHPQEEWLTRATTERFQWPGHRLDEAYVDVAGDVELPSFVRANAARVVGAHGGVEACRRLATLQAADATLQPALAAAIADATRRLGRQLNVAGQP